MSPIVGASALGGLVAGDPQACWGVERDCSSGSDCASIEWLVGFEPDHWWGGYSFDYSWPAASALRAGGGIVVAGSYFGHTGVGGDPLPDSSGQGLYIASYDETGAHQWSRGFPGEPGYNKEAWTWDMATDPSGNSIVSAFASGTVEFSEGCWTGPGLLLAKLVPDGELL